MAQNQSTCKANEPARRCDGLALQLTLTFSRSCSSSQLLWQLEPVTCTRTCASLQKGEPVPAVRDEDSAKERGASFFFFYLLLPARTNVRAAVEHCRERAEKAAVPFPWLCLSCACETLSANCLFLCEPYSIIPFSFLLSQRLHALLRPPGGVAVLKDPEENMNAPEYRS